MQPHHEIGEPRIRDHIIDVDEEGSGGGGGGGPQREVSYETARAWAAERLMSYVEVSAKTDANVNAALLTMVSEIAEAAAAAGGD
jgi:hypothetical protein